MKAMILTAGLGTRLRPLTDTKPKALVEINNIPLIEMVIRKLKAAGFDEIIINVHHFAGQIIDFVQRRNYKEIEISFSDEQNLLLDTGGGLKKASWFFDDKPFLLHNVDVLSEIDFSDFLNYHRNSGSLASLAVRKRETSRQLLFDELNRLSGWRNFKRGEEIITRRTASELIPLAFSGIHMIDPKIFKLMPDENVFSIIDLYLELSSGHIVSAYRHDNSLWLDVGRKENLSIASEILDKISPR